MNEVENVRNKIVESDVCQLISIVVDSLFVLLY